MARGAQGTGTQASKRTRAGRAAPPSDGTDPTRLCACGCGEALLPNAAPDSRLKRGHIRRLQGKVGRALVTGEALVIYGETVDPVELVRSGAVPVSQLPLAARDKLGALGISTGDPQSVKDRTNPAETLKPGNTPGRAGGARRVGTTEGVSKVDYGAIPADEVTDLAALVSSKLYGMETLAESTASPRIQGYAEGYADAWADLQRALDRHSVEI